MQVYLYSQYFPQYTSLGNVNLAFVNHVLEASETRYDFFVGNKNHIVFLIFNQNKVKIEHC